jgi:cobalt-zinc-cadmium efflux system membrane fusion protein
MKSRLFPVAFLLTVLLYACHQGGRETESLVAGKDESAGRGPELIQVTREQYLASGMEVGDPSIITFREQIHASGMVMASPSGRAEVSTLISGRIRKIYHSIGDRIALGAALCSLESNDFISLQQQYAEASQRVRLLEGEYERQKSLSEQKVVAEKEFLRTESDYRTMLATVEGLKARLQMLHVDPSTVEQGNIQSFLEIRSPIEGYITGQELVMGHFINPGEVVVEIVNAQTLQLYLQVFDKDLAGIKPGQSVIFFTPDQPERQFSAILLQPGKSIDPVSKTVQCLAQIEPADLPYLVNNLYVEANIVTVEREALAVPEEALLIREGNSFLYTLEEQNDQELVFSVKEIRAGAVSDGYAEILDKGISQVLIRGAFQLHTGE